MDLPVHDLDDRAVDAFEPLRGSTREERADRQDEERSRDERHRHGAEHRLLKLVGLAQAAAEQKHIPVGAAPRDEQQRALSPLESGRSCLGTTWAFPSTGIDGMAGTSPISLSPLASNRAT